jgi:hypothetical protein
VLQLRKLHVLQTYVVLSANLVHKLVIVQLNLV